jgi:hypothetical protein
MAIFDVKVKIIYLTSSKYDTAIISELIPRFLAHVQSKRLAKAKAIRCNIPL